MQTGAGLSQLKINLTQLQEFTTNNSIIVRSPGRINLIGEHTDYNEGFVLPAAIDKAAYISLTPRADDQINLIAVDLKDTFSTTTNSILSLSTPAWANYLLGVAAQFIKAGIPLSGFDAALTSDIPMGAGLSSSAAVECAMVMALNIATNSQLDKLALIKMAQKAEHEFAGVQCGIMDQFASMMGKKGNVIKLDCRSLEYSYEPFDIKGYKIVLLDTNVKHSLASSEYNIRRGQCEKAVTMIQQHYHSVKSLRDADIDMLDKCVKPYDFIAYQRSKYVMEENRRLVEGCRDLKRNDIKSFGKKMFETHHGLSKLYEVSCPELDFLISQVEGKPGIAGARMMGGGFGGCTINIVQDEVVEQMIKEITEAYTLAINKKLEAYVVSIEDGTRQMHYSF